MKRFITLAALVAATISFGLVAVASAQESPTPAPTDTPAATSTPAATNTPAPTGTSAATSTSTVSTCTGIEFRGGETVTIGQNEITLPGGPDFTISSVSNGFVVCYVDANASVTISATCAEIDRDNPDEDPVADAVLDDIVASCERAPTTVTATPASQGADDDDVIVSTPTLTSQVQGSISPPSTGDAGLK